MRRPRVVATDLDGTLLRSDGTISERTRASLAYAAAAGAAVVFVTGRPPRWIPPVIRQTGPCARVICLNGAAEYDPRYRVLSSISGVPAATGSRVISALRDVVPGLTFAVEAPAGLLMEPGFGRSARDAVHDPHAAVTPRAALPGQRTLQLLARHQALSGDALHHAAVPVTKGHVEVWSTAEEGLLAMSGLGVSKSKALASWCTRNGIGPEDVVAFGDMPNDVPMLTWAGTSYAVANAHPAAAAAARHGAPANDDDGVRRVLDELFR